MTLPQGTWWAKVPLEHAVELRFATDRGLLYWHDAAQRLLSHDGVLVEQLDAEGRAYCAASVVDGAFEDCLAVGASGNAPRLSAIRAMVASHRTDPNAIAIRPQSQDAEADESGPVICACFGVGLETIRNTVRNGAGSLAMVSAALGAGTNCGSCLPELKRIISRARRATTA